MELKFQKVRKVKSPTRGTSGSAGVDFYLPEDIGLIASGNSWFKKNADSLDIIFIQSGGNIKIPSGLKLKLPGYWSMLLVNKSGIVVNKGLIVGACLIDHDYQGEWNIHLINPTNRRVQIQSNMKIVQGIFINTCSGLSITEVKDNLFDKMTERGEGGFGSTGE